MEQRHLPEDFKEFLKLLNSTNVQYLLKNKASTGRKKDEADLEELRKFMR